MVIILKKSIKQVLLVSLILSCVSCDKIFNLSINSYTGPAELTITNVTTGESRTEQGAVVYVGEGDPKAYHFKHGDVMQLKFTPPEKYQKDSFSVDYEVFDVKVTIIDRPYIYELNISEDIPVGTYFVKCSAMCDKWTSGSCKQEMEFRVDE